MNELEELLSQAIDAGASEAELAEIARLYNARSGEKKKEPIKGKPYTGVGSMDYGVSSNPALKGVETAKAKAAKATEQQPTKQAEQPYKEREYLDISKVKTDITSSSDALYKPKAEEAKVMDKSAKTIEQKDAYLATKKERGIVRNPVKRGIGESEESFMDRQIETMSNLMVGDSPTWIYDDWSSKAGTRSKSFPTTENMDLVQIGEQKKAVFDDYLDYLWNSGQKEKAQQYKSTYDALSEKMLKGDIGFGEQSKLDAIQGEAFSAYNRALTNKIEAIEATSDVDMFSRNTTIVANKINELEKQLTQLGEPKTKQDIDKYNAILAKYQALVKDVDGIREATGFTAEKEAELQGAYSLLLDGQKLDKHSRSLNAEYSADKDELERIRMAEGQDELAADNIFSETGEFINTALGAAWLTLGNSVLSLPQLPKIMGDKLGDTDYDVFDSIYDAMEGKKEIRGAYLGSGQYMEGVERPTYLHVADVIGSAIGSMASMVAPAKFVQGAALTAGKTIAKAEKLGKIASGMQTYQMMLPDNYKAALEAGKSPQDAAIEASILSMISALVEQGVPDVPSQDIVKTGLKVFRETGDMAKALKTSAMRYTEAALIKEPLEEFTELTSGNIAKEALGGYKDTWSAQEYVDSFIGAVGVGGVMTALNRGSSTELHPDEKLVNRYVAENYKRLVPQFIQVTDDPMEAAKAGERMKVAGELLDKLKSNSSWAEMDDSSKDEAFDLANKAEMLRAKIKDSKSLGVADPYAEAELAKLEGKLQETLTARKTKVDLEGGKQEFSDAEVKDSQQEVERLRAEEQTELDSKIENADQYRVDGKVDRAKLTKEEDIKAFDEVYDKYDKLITPLLSSTEQAQEVAAEPEQVTEVVETPQEEVVVEETPENIGSKRKPIGGGKYVRYNPDDVLPLLNDYTPTSIAEVEDYVSQVVPNDASVEAYKIVPINAIQTSEKIDKKDREAIDKIKEGIKNGDDIPPLVLDFSPVIQNGEAYKFGLMDGHHRYIAYKEMGIKNIPSAIVTSREHYTFETNDTDVKTVFEQPLPSQEITPNEQTPIELKDVEPIRQLGTGANVYFETNKHRVNDDLKSGKVLLNVGSKEDEVPMANIEFDNAAEAVAVAKELDRIYPKGVPNAVLIDKVVEDIRKKQAQEVKAVESLLSKEQTKEKNGGDKAVAEDTAVQGNDVVGDEGSRGANAPRTETDGGNRAVERGVFEADEEIGRILFGGDSGRGGKDEGQDGVGGDLSPQDVLGDRGQEGDRGEPNNVDGGGDVLEVGGDIQALEAKAKSLKGSIQGRVNDLLSDVARYNRLGVKSRASEGANKLMGNIQKEAKKLGLDFGYLGGKVKITKDGKRVAPRGTVRMASENQAVYNRAKNDSNKSADMAVAVSLAEGAKVPSRLFGELTMLDKDSTEYKKAKKAGWISETMDGDISNITDRMNETYGTTYTPDEVANAFATYLGYGSRAAVKNEVIRLQKEQDKTLLEDEGNQRATFEAEKIVDEAEAAYDKKLAALKAAGDAKKVAAHVEGRNDFIEKEITRIASGDKLVPIENIDSYAKRIFAKREDAKDTRAYDTIPDEEPFSLGGEDAPFQESDDPFVEVLNTFTDTYDKVGLVEAVKAAKEKLAALNDNGEARKKFLKYLEDNKEFFSAGEKKEKKTIVVKSREGYKKALRELLPQISDEDIERLAVVGDAMAKYAMTIDPEMTSEDAWSAVQGAMSNDIQQLSNKLNQENGLERWIGGNEMYAGSSIQDVKTGEKVVLRVFHGTTNEFDVFDSSVKGNIEGHLGKVNYFTSDIQDANENYLAEGADITSRMDSRQDELEDTLRYDFPTNEKGILFQSIIDKYNITTNEVKDLYPSGKPKYIQAKEISRFLAEKELKGGTEKTLELFVKLNNPVVLGGDPQWFETSNISDSDLDDAATEIAEEFGVSEDEAKEDYSFDIRQRAIENTGYTPLHIDALTEALQDNGYDGNMASEILGDLAYEDSVDLNQIEKLIRGYEIYENEEGEFASSQVIADFFKNLGFDGIILTDVSGRFKNMGLGKTTSHIQVFDEFNNQIKSATDNSGAFSEDTNNIYRQGVKGATSIEQGITAYTEAADISTLIHEPAHNFMALLEQMASNGNQKAKDHLKTIKEFGASEQGEKFFDRSKKAGESWTKGKEYDPTDPTFLQELFARSAEKYFMEGDKAGFSKKMMEVFDAFAKFLKDLYKGALNSPEYIELSPQMRDLFDALYDKTATRKIDSKNVTPKLRNVIRAFVENSNLPQADKDAIANDKRNMAEIFTFDEMEALVDSLIAENGIDAVLDEAMKEYSAIPLELKSVVYGKALIDLRDRIAIAKGDEKADLQQRYEDVYEILARIGKKAGFYNAYIARIYSQDPRAIAKSILKKIKRDSLRGEDYDIAEKAAGEVEQILNADENMASAVEDAMGEFDNVLDALGKLKAIERDIARLKNQKVKVSKQNEILKTTVTLKKLGKNTSAVRVAFKIRAEKAAENIKKLRRPDSSNMGIKAAEFLPYAIDWAFCTLAGKAMDFTTFSSAAKKVMGADGSPYFAEIYKRAKGMLESEGYDVSELDEDGVVDAMAEYLKKKDEQEKELAKKAEIIKLTESLLKKMNPTPSTSSGKTKKTLLELAGDIDELAGNTNMTDVVSDYLDVKESEKKAMALERKIKKFENRLNPTPKESDKETISLEDFADELDQETGSKKYSDAVKQKRDRELKAKEAKINAKLQREFGSKIKTRIGESTKKTKAEIAAEKAKKKSDLRKLAESLDAANNTNWFTESLDSMIETEQMIADQKRLMAAQDELFEMTLPKGPTTKQVESRKDKLRRKAADLDAEMGGSYFSDLVEKTIQEEEIQSAAKKKSNDIEAKKKRLSRMMSESIGRSTPQKKRNEILNELASEIDYYEGGSTYSRFLSQYLGSASNLSNIIKDALIKAGFSSKDAQGNDTGVVNWKAIVKDAKDVNQTVDKIMAAAKDNLSPKDYNNVERALKDKLTDIITERKRKAVENFIKNRERSALRKAMGKVTRPSRLDKLMDLYRMGGVKKKEILEAIGEDFGVAKYSASDEEFIEAWADERSRAAEIGSDIEIARLDKIMQAFQEYRLNPHLSVDKLWSENVNAMLAAFPTFAQNAQNVYETAIINPIIDAALAQLNVNGNVKAFLKGKDTKGLGDKYIVKVAMQAYVKAFMTAADILIGGVDVISAQGTRTGNREGTPSVEYYNYTRYDLGQKNVLTAIDKQRQKIIRMFPRVASAVDAFGGVVTQESKLYILLREDLISQGFSFKDASMGAWEMMNRAEFDKALEQARKEFPNYNGVQHRRRAYEILEGKVIEKGGKGGTEAFKNAQLAANISNYKATEIGLLSGIGYAINFVSKAMINAIKTKEVNAKSIAERRFYKALNFFAGSPMRSATLFLKPTMNVMEQQLKYATFANPITMSYTAIRLSAMIGMNFMGKKEVDSQRIISDIMKGIIGYVIAYGLFDWDDEEEKKKLQGVGPNDKFEANEERNVREFKSYDGVSLKWWGHLEMMGLISAIEADNERYRQDVDVLRLVNALTTGAYAESLRRSLEGMNSDKDGIEKLVAGMKDFAIGYGGRLANPIGRVFNDIAYTQMNKQKPVTTNDLLLKSLGFSFMINRPMIDAYGHEYKEGRNNKYSVDGLIKQVFEFAAESKEINDFRDKYNVPLSSYINKDFIKYYDKELGEVVDEEMRYEVDSLAKKYRGITYQNYVNSQKQMNIEQPTGDELRQKVDNLGPKAKEAYENGDIFFVKRTLANGDTRITREEVNKTLLEETIKEAKRKGIKVEDQLFTSYVEGVVKKDFSDLNSAAKRVARYYYAKKNNLEIDEIFEWSEVEDDMKLLEKYGVVFEKEEVK